MGRKQKYHINLSDEDVKNLKAIIRKKGTSRSMIHRCQVLLDMDESHGEIFTKERCSKSNGVSLSMISVLMRKYAEQGLESAIEYKRNPNSDNTRRKVDGRIEAKIIQIACGPVPEGHARWTLRLLEKQMKIELDIPIGVNAIRRALKKTNFNLTKRHTGAFRRKKTRNL